MTWLYRILAIGSLLGLLPLGYRAWAVHQQGIGEARATATYNAVIDKQKREAGQLLQAETARANAATARLIEFKTEREKHDVENQSTIADLAVRLRAAARLRDPNAAAGCGGGGGGAPGADPARAGGGAADLAPAGGLFSAGATELLQRLTRESDEINVAYISCRPDAMNVREVLR